MKEAGYRIVIREVTARALAVSETKFSGAELVTVVAPERGDVERMNESTNGSVALRLELRASDRNNFSPLLAPMGSVVIRHQEVCYDQGAACVWRKRRPSGIAGFRSGQYGAEFGAQPEGLQSVVSRISDPSYLTLVGKASGWGVGRQFSVWSEEAIGIQ